MHSQKEKREFNLYIDNANVCPVSILLKLKILDIKCLAPCPETIVVAEKFTKFIIGSFALADLEKPADK